MTDDTSLPATIASGAVTVLSGVPAPIANGAWKGISQLIGSAFAIPKSWIDGITEGIEDRNYANRQLRRGLADAALVAAKGDEALVERTLSRLLADAVPKQRNREAIANKVHQELVATAATAPSEEQVPPTDEWLDRFSKHAESVSDDDAQRLWAKIMAREVCKPGSMAHGTLDLIARLSRGQAEAFQRLAERSFGNLLPGAAMRRDRAAMRDFITATDAGLVRDHLDFAHHFDIEGRNYGGLVGRDYFLEVRGSPELTSSAVISCLYLSSAGYELTEVLKPVGETSVAVEFAREIGALGFDAIVLYRMDAQGQMSEPRELYTRSNVP